MARTFPKFKSHNEAFCSNCGGDFGDGYWDKSGFPQARGEWKQICNKCGMDTFYDLGRDPAPPALVSNETAYGSAQRLSFAIKCF